jgi:ferredoxin
MIPLDLEGVNVVIGPHAVRLEPERSITEDGGKRTMSYVITEQCAGTCDTACADVCPVDCITGPVPVDQIKTVPRDERGRRFPDLQLYIDPDECIDCAICVPACPVEAIFEDANLPLKSHGAVAANAAFFGR